MELNNNDYRLGIKRSFKVYFVHLDGLAKYIFLF